MGEPASAGTDFADGGSNPGEDGLGRGHLAADSSRPEIGTPGESGVFLAGFGKRARLSLETDADLFSRRAR